MNNHKLHEGIMYCIFGAILILMTIPLVFHYVMFAFKVVFIIFGSLAILGGLIQLKDSLKKKKDV